MRPTDHSEPDVFPAARFRVVPRPAAAILFHYGPDGSVLASRGDLTGSGPTPEDALADLKAKEAARPPEE